MQILVLPNAEAAAKRAALMLAESASLAIRKRGLFTLAVSGGSTPWLMLNEWVKLELDWQRVHVFQVDERVAPDGDRSRNWTHIAQALSRIPTPTIHAYPMAVDSNELGAAAIEYENRLRNVAGSPPKLDLVHLGLGLDGHTASLVPGDTALDIRDSDVTPTTVAYQGHRRLTLTFQAINRARNILWLVTGPEKREVLSKLLHGDRSIPAGRIRGAHATVLTDNAAMGLSGDSESSALGSA